MKAAVCYENGGPEVFKFEEVTDPVCGRDDVLIKVEASSIEEGDLINREIRSLARVPHQCAGTVVVVGPDVERLRVGDRMTAILPWRRMQSWTWRRKPRRGSYRGADRPGVPLSEAADAHRRALSREVVGRVVLRP